MKLSTPSSLGLLQLLIACILVAIYTCPGDAMHHGPMIIFKAGKGMAHGGGGMGGALGLLAAGLLIKSLTHLEKHQHHHQGGGYGGGGGMGYGHGMGYVPQSFSSHDAHLGHYGYEPQSHGGSMMWAR